MSFARKGFSNWLVNLASQVTGTLAIGSGGTGATTLTDHGVLVGSGTDAITPLSVGATGTILAGTTGADPAFTATPTGLTSIGANTFDTNVAAAGVTLSGTTLSADGTNADIDINITPKGTGEVNITKADIDGGTVDSAVIGGATPAAGTFTTVSGNITQSAVADTTLSSAPKVFVVYDGATPYYFKAYPTKA